MCVTLPFPPRGNVYFPGCFDVYCVFCLLWREEMAGLLPFEQSVNCIWSLLNSGKDFFFLICVFFLFQREVQLQKWVVILVFLQFQDRDKSRYYVCSITSRMCSMFFFNDLKCLSQSIPHLLCSIYAKRHKQKQQQQKNKNISGRERWD